MGCVDTWVRGLRGSNFYVLCVGYVGQNVFYVGQNVFYVGQHVTWAIILRGLRGSNIFLCGSIFLRGSTFFA